MKTIIIAILAIFITTGFTSCEKRPVVVTELPPDRLLMDCSYAHLPPIDDWKNLTEEEREDLLIQKHIENINYIKICNVDKEQLRIWKVRMLDLIKQYE